ncbi:hypothetical protein GGQ85_004539 [Nitrobacter vulgaris]|nr:hypothetical protein [Nitrobacter vulgaris]
MIAKCSLLAKINAEARRGFVAEHGKWKWRFHASGLEGSGSGQSPRTDRHSGFPIGLIADS